ncbi:hypothetical protein MNBD_BACTEROID05-1308 [hydrothermal vent metagenome]|uniref:Uncharacterized protein n=1 Tax=hydrothermal vent metagenome TaxID=652676 RepID=A0A3B0TJA2_9ZZZZ
MLRSPNVLCSALEYGCYIVTVEIIDLALRENRGIISYQVVQEFINVMGSKLKKKKLRSNLPYFLAQCLYPGGQVFSDFNLYDMVIRLKRKYRRMKP